MRSGFIIISNKDLTDNLKAALTKQLFLSEIITGDEFNARIAKDPNYPTEVRLNKLNVLVLKDLSDFSNTSLADIVIFIKAGLATIEYNKFGPPSKTFPVVNLTMDQLLQNTNNGVINTNISTIQDNISAPLFVKSDTLLFPFGTDPNDGNN